MPRLQIIAPALALAFAVSPATATAAPWTPPKPKFGHAKFNWLQHECVWTENGFRTRAAIDTWVYKLKSKYGMYRQKVKLQVDKRAGYSGTTWRKVDAKTFAKKKPNGDYHWFQKGQQAQQLGIGLPDAMRTTWKTGLQPDQGELSIKATVWLKRSGSPKAVWRYKTRSPTFRCYDFVMSP